jgi:hypothetical protein
MVYIKTKEILQILGILNLALIFGLYCYNHIRHKRLANGSYIDDSAVFEAYSN